MVFRWRDEHMDAFLDNYRKYECLWNISNDLYKNRAERENAYVQLRNDMQIPELTVADIKNKIKTIRTNYKNELTKILKSEKSGSGCSEIYIPRLFWFKKADAFLRGVCEARESTSNLNFEALLAPDDNSSLQSHPEVAQENTQNTDGAGNQVPTASIRTPQSSRATKQKSAMKRPSNMSQIENSVKKLEKISKLCQSDDEDEFDLFCRSLAVQLKKMPLDRALICQENLQGVMRQERLYQLNSNHQNQDQLHSNSSYTSTPAVSPLDLHNSSESVQLHWSQKKRVLQDIDETSTQESQEIISEAFGIKW